MPNMSGLSIDPSMSFDPYPTSFDASQLQSSYSDFSPASIFETFEDFGTDFTSDSAASPISPISPVLSASSYGYPTTEGWGAWDTIEHSPEPENFFKTNPFTNASIVDFAARNPSMSPAINPMDLAMPVSPLFQTAPQQPLMLPSQRQQQQEGDATNATTMDDAAKRYPSRNLKRKSSTPAADDELPPAPKRSSPPPSAASTTTPAAPRRSSASGPKKTAHNMIEKRYRTNLNDKITQLRDAVPSLRLVAQRTEHPGMFDDCDDSQFGDDGSLAGLAQGAKLNKATILAKATEYICQLERRNHGLETENNALRGRMEGLEMMLMGRQGNGWN
ncbi:helix-loop-helix DNA-binding domain-containing protein [Cladorrhinum sp. PSN259]|nr:helix-loop-helix DNA-binding domain-containing protein [Cladorrhinum sp. PSN259]